MRPSAQDSNVHFETLRNLSAAREQTFKIQEPESPINSPESIQKKDNLLYI